MPLDQNQKSKKDRIREERKTRSLIVRIKSKYEKSFLEPTLLAIHPSIEKILFPRQNRPKFFFALCKSVEDVSSVKKAIEEFEESDLIEKLVVKNKNRPEVKKKSPLTDAKCTIMLQNGPKTLTKNEILKLAPTAIEIKFLPITNVKYTNWKIVLPNAADRAKLSAALMNLKKPKAAKSS